MVRTLREEIVDNTASARMSLWVVLQELKNKYPSKKKIKGPMEIVRKSLDNLNEFSQKVEEVVVDPLLEYDEEIKWFMKTTEPDTGNTWDEEMTSDVQKVGEAIIVEHCQRVIENFNQTLRPHENLRELVEVYKVVSYTKKTKLS